jgi:hypothetical protein
VSKSPSFSLIIVVILAAFVLPSFGAAEDLLGPVDRERILAHSPAWQESVAAYQPDPAAIEKLRGLGREVRIEVFFGSWCSDSAAHVPAFFKVLDLAETPLLQPAYFGVPEAKDKRAEYVQGRKIVKLPTFLVLVDGREIGRIEETPKKSVEADLVKILGL